ncbi:unnamed protein product [Effrenium voratum]|uniref:Uncharacterized protein n=1 Tax=Effrenium voratum TaxID=2562239 RepID=A0AA36JFQ2_9DINO|nr:unnamed protein product [Effrenium voratum]CAJ1404804.1 unnamed protein product [Effrenium voratum]CAJ1448976.1 unnamed protein product [Effrenium voratum]
MPRSSGQARSAGHQSPGLSLEFTDSVPQDMQWLGSGPCLPAVIDVSMRGIFDSGKRRDVGPHCFRAEMTLPGICVQRCSHHKTKPKSTESTMCRLQDAEPDCGGPPRLTLVGHQWRVRICQCYL